MEYGLEERTRDAIKELEERWKEEGEDKYFQDNIHEIADSHTPIYYSDILAIAANNIDMATLEPEIGPAFDGAPTPINIIAANIYEYIYRALDERFHELREE